MIKRIKFKVSFPSTGRTFEGEHRFATGLTAISGENEVGKTLRLELIRYALFGSKALRSAAAEYRNLAVEMEFRARGEDYTITRGSNCRLLCGETPIASGTRPVNARIIEILGYDLTVFDVANACNQGQVEALGAMKPAERKRMVDQTIGLDALDELQRILAEKAVGLRQTADGILSGLVAPVEPARPENYRPSADCLAAKNEAKARADEWQQLRGWLDHAPCDEPVAPTTNIGETVDALRRHQRRRDDLRSAIGSLEGQLRGLKRTEVTIEEVDTLEGKLRAFQAYREAQAKLAAFNAPRCARAQLDRWAEDERLLERYAEKDRLVAEIERLENHGSVECPNCRHSFPILGRQVEVLRQQLETLYGTLADEARPAEPPLTAAGRRDESRLVDAWEQSADERATLAAVPAAEDPGVGALDLLKLRAALVDQEERRAIDARLEELRPELARLPDRAAELEERQRYEWALLRYAKDRRAFDEAQAQRVGKEARLNELGNAPQAYHDLLSALTVARDHEARIAAYREARAAYDGARANAQTHLDKADAYGRARAALKTVRARVKGFLVPSLNRVASRLVHQMTNGMRSDIKIDEEFDIVVDGQPLDTLSGSGKAVTNLAIRIGLGQVLTNKVFSAFLGDEIDAALDDDRAGATAGCLQGLASSIDQIILVSHKKPEADRHIDL